MSAGIFELRHGVTDEVTIFALDTTRNPTGARVIGHQYQVTAGQTDKGGESGAFVATLFFFNLDNDFLAFAERFLDGDTATIAGAFLEVAACNFFQWQETVPLGTIIHKGGFETGLDAGDFTFVYVGFFLSSGRYLNIEIDRVSGRRPERHAALRAAWR